MSFRSKFALVPLVIALLGAVSAGPADATLTYLETFPATSAGAGTGAGQLGAPASPSGAAVAVSSTTGHVYVSDSTNNRVQQYDAAGVFVRMWGKGVNQTSGGDVCPRPANPGDVCKAGEASSEPGAFKAPNGIAVDNSTGPGAGSVYVQDQNNLRVQRFSADGTFVLTWGKGVNQTSGGDVCPRPGNPGDVCGPGSDSVNPGGFQTLRERFTIAVDGDGLVYALSAYPLAEELGAENRLQRFDHTGAFLGQFARKRFDQGGITSGKGVSADAAGRVYVADESGGTGAQVIKVFGSEDFTTDGLSGGHDFKFSGGDGANGVAVDPSNGYIFLNNQGSSGPCKTTETEQGTHVTEYRPGGDELVDCSPSSTPGIDKLTIDGFAVSPSHKLYAVVGSQIRVFSVPTSGPPALGATLLRKVTTNSALVEAQVAGKLADTVAHVELGTGGPCSVNQCDSGESVPAGATVSPRAVDLPIAGLKPDTTYHYRVVVDNGVGEPIAGPDLSLHTYPAPSFEECSNNLARQQTGASMLADCRAYEIVSAPDAGGYDVESDTVAGQAPFDGFSGVSGRALYGLDNGVVPGVAGNPTNRGPDPYLAVRDGANQRWTTSYVGIPADAPDGALTSNPFSPTLLEADQGIDSLAFGGPELCDPCFADGSVGIPIHRPDGSLEQGMAGSLPVADPVPADGVARHFSADGTHFLFSSTQQFEPEGNSSGTDVTIYDRDLETGVTQVASTLPGGAAITDGTGVRALDISADGSHILIGHVVATDAAGNEYLELYMHHGSSPNSVPILTGTAGALFAGMTSDGSQVYFTTRENLDDETADTSVDLFRATLGGGSADIQRVSIGTGGAGEGDACDPAGDSYNRENWNTAPGGPQDCSVVALGGAGGVAPDSGAVYFLSPEELDGDGVDGAPNLFLARPGDGPAFVATLESGASATIPPDAYNLTREFGTSVLPQGAAVDEQDSSVYVLDQNNDFGFGPGPRIRKYDSSGALDTDFASSGVLDGSNSGSPFVGAAFVFPVNVPAQIAVANDPSSPNYQHLYAVSTSFPFFGAPSGAVKRFDSSGAWKETVSFSNEAPTAVAVSPDGDRVYVAVAVTSSTGLIRVYDVDQTTGGLINPASFPVTGAPIGLGVDSNERVFVANGSSIRVFNGAPGVGFGTALSILESGSSSGVTVDPHDDHVFVDKGNQLIEYAPGGTQIGGPIGTSQISGSVSLAATDGRLFVSNPGNSNVRVFERTTIPDRAYDHPLVLNSVRDPEARHPEDFQATASGEHAVFPSVLPLDGFDAGGKYELFRYAESGPSLECVSCTPTGQFPVGDAVLPSKGLGVADDGRVFYNSRDSLVLRDVNGKQDAYEFDGERTELISSGTSSSDSSLLTVTRDGVDAFFFTRETLDSNDRNGSHVKLYDAREGGGFFTLPGEPGCVASDECHGPGSEPAPVLSAPTTAGEGGNLKLRCKRPKVRRGDRCVKKKKGRKRGAKRAGHRSDKQRASADRRRSK